MKKYKTTFASIDFNSPKCMNPKVPNSYEDECGDPTHSVKIIWSLVGSTSDGQNLFWFWEGIETNE